MEKTETMWVKRLAEGDERAFRYLYEHHYAVLCHVAESYVKDSFVAETIVGDVIFHLWEIRAQLHIETSLRSYLIQAVRNRALNHLATPGHRLEVAFSALDDEQGMEQRADSTHLQPLGILLERELEEEVASAVRSLPDECRRVFDKSRFEGKTYDEIAGELGISVNTVKYHIKNALVLLHRRLGKYLTGLLLYLFS